MACILTLGPEAFRRSSSLRVARAIATSSRASSGTSKRSELVRRAFTCLQVQKQVRSRDVEQEMKVRLLKFS